MFTLLHRITCSLLIVFGATTHAATYTVSSTDDAGAGTLRAALLDANANAGMDRIEFAIPGASPFVIVVSTPLPSIGDAVVIDGDSRPGILIDGALLVAGTGLEVLAGGSGTEIRGLEIGYFPEDGIRLNGASNVTLAGNTVRGNLNGINLIASENNNIGMKHHGMKHHGMKHHGMKRRGNTVIDNMEVGIAIQFESHGNRVTHNDVWGLGLAAPDYVTNRGIVLAYGASDNDVTYNRVHDQGNQGILAAFNVDRNDISDNYIENCFREGIEITGEAFLFGSGATATENTIARNVLVNNTHLDEAGDITLFSGAHGNVVKDNHITGSDDGIGMGIWLFINNNDNQLLNNVIVGTTTGVQMLPTDRSLFEIGFVGGASGNIVKGNKISDSILDGINNTDLAPWFVGNFSDNRISGNTVTNSGRNGIHIANPDALGVVTNNRIAKNRIKKITGDGVILDTDVSGNRVTENKFRRIGGNGVTILGDVNRVVRNKFSQVSGLDIDDQGVGNITD